MLFDIFSLICSLSPCGRAFFFVLLHHLKKGSSKAVRNIERVAPSLPFSL